MNKKTLILIAVIAIIAASIFYLESMKARPNATDTIKEEEAMQANGSDAAIATTDAPSPHYVADEAVITAKSKQYTKAPDLTGITGYVNTPEFTLEQLRGRVVLVDFWTYSCINCIRTQPYLNAWYETYGNDGFVIVGVHTPEFEFEKVTENVRMSMERSNIKYPVVQDNNYETWRAYKNRYWPRKYLIDIDGFIRYDHIGEGAYEETEEMIRKLLMERKERLGLELNMSKSSQPNATQPDFGRVQTPEIYFGYKFSRGNFGSAEGFAPEQINKYEVPKSLSLHNAYLTGGWLNKADYSELVSQNGSIILAYAAKNVNIVAGAESTTEIEILLDGTEINSSFAGRDGNSIREEKLYNIVAADGYGEHILEIKISQPGLRIYTFTFG